MDSTNNKDETVPVVTPTAVPRRRHMGRWLTLLAVLLIVGGVFTLTWFNSNDSGKVQATSVASVQITPDGFEPQTIKVKKGESVTWVNTESRPHQVVADPYPSGDTLKSLNSLEPLSEGDSYASTFEQAGTYTYHDQLDPASFKGTVIVE
jgi:plastocyanin